MNVETVPISRVMRWFGYLVAFTLCTVWLAYTLPGYIPILFAFAVLMVGRPVVVARVTDAELEAWLALG
jgi:hypothetical protein